MLKARVNELIIFGLSEDNIKKLREGKPIAFSGDKLGVPEFNFAIVYGVTEQAIAEDLVAHDILPEEALCTPQNATIN